MLFVLHYHAAVYVEGLAGNIAGIVRCQEQDGLGHFFRLGDAAHGNGLDHGIDGVFTEDSRHIRGDASRCYGIAADIARSQFFGYGLGEANEAGFGSGVIGLAGIARFADDMT